MPRNHGKNAQIARTRWLEGEPFPHASCAGRDGLRHVKIVPVYFANYEFQDSIESESRFALTGYPKKTPDDVRNDIWNKAKELGIPAQKDAIKIAMDNGSVDIGLDYSVPIDLAVYQFTLQFHPHADNHTI